MIVVVDSITYKIIDVTGCEGQPMVWGCDVTKPVTGANLVLLELSSLPKEILEKIYVNKHRWDFITAVTKND